MPRRQIVRRQRHAMARQVGRAGDVDQAQHAYRPRHQARIRQHADSQHAVHALFDQVHGTVRHAQRDVDLRIGLQKRRQRWRHDEAAHTSGHVHAQHAAGTHRTVAKEVLGLFHVSHQAQTALIEGSAFLRGRHLPRGAVQQPRAQPALQFLHGGRHGGARQAQRVRRAREVRAFDDAGVNPEQIYAVHRADGSCEAWPHCS
jgi:hypothetical protein